jgi:hypothetical protein
MVRHSSAQTAAHGVLRANWQLVALLAVCACHAGCGGSAATDLKKAAADAQQAAANVQQAVTETTSAAAGLTTGSIELNVDGPLKVERCSAWFTPPSGDRAAVLQLTTSETLDVDPKFVEYPSVFVWASVPVKDPSELAGQKISGQLMVRRDSGTGAWQTATTVPVSISVLSANAWSIQCEVKDAELVRVDGEGRTKVSGKFVALWK